MTNRLQWDVFISSQIPAVTNDLPPGASEMKWSPISSTLISGKRDAVLVDTAITVEQNQKLAEWIAASGKNLTTIYATHGHGEPPSAAVAEGCAGGSADRGVTARCSVFETTNSGAADELTSSPRQVIWDVRDDDAGVEQQCRLES